MSKTEFIEASKKSVNTVLMNKVNGLFRKTGNERDFLLFLIVGSFSGIATGIYTSIFNNYLSDVFKLSAEARGGVEFPREFPGVIIVVVLGFLSFLGNTRISAIGMVMAAAGIAGLGLLSPSYTVMLVWMMLMSLGVHILFTLTPVIGMSLSKKEEYGMRLGQINAVKLAVTILGYLIVWVGFKYLSFSYRVAFILAAIAYACAALFLGLMNPQKPEKKPVRFVFRKEYMLFYGMSIVNGARKQVFMTFAPWVLVQVYHLGPPVFAMLGIAISAVGILTRTVVGKGIDELGERVVLVTEAALLIILCIGYAYAADLFTAKIAVVIVAICYVLDEGLVAVGMARSTYMKKIAVHEDDVTPTLSAGVSLDHVAATTVPFLGGLLWAAVGYKYVFIAAAGIAVINLIMALQVKIENVQA